MRICFWPKICHKPCPKNHHCEGHPNDAKAAKGPTLSYGEYPLMLHISRIPFHSKLSAPE